MRRKPVDERCEPTSARHPGLSLPALGAHSWGAIPGPTLLATAVSFVVAYFSIGWLLRFGAKNSFTSFIVCRRVLGVLLVVLLLSHVTTPV